MIFGIAYISVWFFFLVFVSKLLQFMCTYSQLLQVQAIAFCLSIFLRWGKAKWRPSVWSCDVQRQKKRFYIAFVFFFFLPRTCVCQCIINPFPKMISIQKLIKIKENLRFWIDGQEWKWNVKRTKKLGGISWRVMNKKREREKRRKWMSGREK